MKYIFLIYSVFSYISFITMLVLGWFACKELRTEYLYWKAISCLFFSLLVFGALVISGLFIIIVRRKSKEIAPITVMFFNNLLLLITIIFYLKFL